MPLRPRPPPGRAGPAPGRWPPAPPPPPPPPPRGPAPGPAPGPPRPPGRVPVPGPPRPPGPPGPPEPAKPPGPREPTGRGGMLLGLGRGPPGRGPPGRGASPGPPGPGRAGKRVPPGRGAPGPPGRPACWPVPAGPPAAAPPAPPVAPGAPGWPGRAPRGADPIPVAVELNGLLPGRGPGRGGPGVPAGARDGEPPGREAPGPGRGAAGLGVLGALGPAPSAAAAVPCAAGASGRPCGNGTGGLGPGAWAGWPPAPGAGPAAGPGSAAGTAGAAGLLPFGPAWPARAAASAAPVAVGPAAAGAAAAAVGSGALAPGAVAADGDAAAGCAARASPRAPVAPARACLGCCVANASLSLRTTGASIVEDADRTNSPISWSLAITALLSTPNSFASSYTRTFATALPLLGPARPDPSAGRGSACSVRRQLLLFIAACSSVAHRNLSLLSPGWVAPALRFLPSAPPSPRPACPRLPGRGPAGHCAAANCPAAHCPAATVQDTRQACRFRLVPAAAAPARRPAGAALPRSIPGRDAGTRPGQALAPADRERSRSRLPPGEASRTWPHGIRIPHRSGSLARAGPAADTA